MPPAWQVSAIDWLCCSGAACEHPETASCRAEGLAYLSRLKQELPERLSDSEFGDIFDSRRPEQPRLRFERYTFFHDPSDSQRATHRRLRRAASAISKPVSALTVGAITGPITTQRGVTLIRLRGAQPAVHLPWEDPRTQAALRTELCPARITKARRQYLSDLRTQVPLSIDQTGIESRWGVQLTPTQPR